jgi:hypothetical protein
MTTLTLLVTYSVECEKEEGMDFIRETAMRLPVEAGGNTEETGEFKIKRIGVEEIR